MVTTFARIVRSRDKGTIKGGKSFWKWVGQGHFSLSFFLFLFFQFFFEIIDSERNFFLRARILSNKSCGIFLSFLMLIIFNSTFEHYFFFVIQKSRKIWIKNVNFRHGRDSGFKSGGFKNKIRKTESSGR